MLLQELNPHLRFAAALRYEMFFNHRTVKVTDCRLFYITEGNARLHIGARQYSLCAGNLFYCCAGSEYTVETTAGFSLISLNFDLSQSHCERILPISPSSDQGTWATLPVYLDQVEDSDFLNSNFLLENAAEFRAELEQIALHFSSGGRFAPQLCSALLKTLLIRLHCPREGSLPPGILPVLHYIEQNYAKPISNEDLAAIAGYHEYHLNRLFRACTGAGLHSYLLSIRLNRAVYLMLNTNTPLQTIAEQVGFGSYPHFSSYFKQRFSCSPAEYRKRHRGSI